MTTIHTERLQLLPLNLSQLQLYIDGPVLLARSIGLPETDLDIEPEFWAEVPEAIEKICIPNVAKHSENYEWFTHWAIILLSENRIVGGIGLSGLPGENGEVQTGYFVDRRYEGRGFATEATGALVKWAFQNPDVQAVVADTLRDGFASQRVLQKCGFVFQHETEEGNLHWRRER